MAFEIFRPRKKMPMLSRLQKSFLFSFVGYTFLILAIQAIVFYYFQELMQQTLATFSASLTPEAQAQFAEQVLKFELVFALTVVVLVAISFMHGLNFTRSIAGPIYSLTRFFQECAKEGELKEMALRKEDHFQELAECIKIIVKKQRTNKSRD